PFSSRRPTDTALPRHIPGKGRSAWCPQEVRLDIRTVQGSMKVRKGKWPPVEGFRGPRGKKGRRPRHSPGEVPLHSGRGRSGVRCPWAPSERHLAPWVDPGGGKPRFLRSFVERSPVIVCINSWVRGNSS